MSVPTDRLDSADWIELLDRLNQIRLSNDWSYRELAADVSRVTGLDISAQTLQPLLTPTGTERQKPYDRTLFKIRKYLDAAFSDTDSKKAAVR